MGQEAMKVMKSYYGEDWGVYFDGKWRFGYATEDEARLKGEALIAQKAKDEAFRKGVPSEAAMALYWEFIEAYAPYQNGGEPGSEIAKDIRKLQAGLQALRAEYLPRAEALDKRLAKKIRLFTHTG